MKKQEQKKIALRTKKWNEIKEFSVATQMPMAMIVETLWNNFKGTQLHKLMLQTAEARKNMGGDNE